MAILNNPNLEKYSFKKGNKFGRLGKGKLKRKTVLKNFLKKAIESNRELGINSIEDFDEIAFQKILQGLVKGGVKESALIALKLLEFRFPKKKEVDLGQETRKILVVHRPTNELLNKE